MDLCLIAVLMCPMFGSMGTEVLGDWGSDVLVWLSDNMLFNAGDVHVWLLWSGSILWGIGCNDKFRSNWLVSLTSNSASMSG